MQARAALDRWLFRLRGPEPAPITLGFRRIFVLPTGAGYAYSVGLLLMLAGSLNYGLSLGYLLTFLLSGLGVVAILQTFRNLVQIRVLPGRAAPVFAGERCRFDLLLDNPGDDARRAIAVGVRGARALHTDIPPHGVASVVLELAATRRGWMRLGRLTLVTRYPLGLIRAWSYVEPDVCCLIYPSPEHAPPALPWPTTATGEQGGSGRGVEDFAGLRGYQPADSPRHIAWKIAARDGPLVTKQFSGNASRTLWLDWHGLPPQMGDEARLSRLAAWLLQAREAGLPCGLRLPGREFAPAADAAHFQACLKALALYGEAEGPPA
jgi:uncharacterized protein (DUF58 family)